MRFFGGVALSGVTLFGLSSSAAGCAATSAATPPSPSSGFVVAPVTPEPSTVSDVSAKNGELVFKYWYPGYLPGWFGRITLLLDATDQSASLRITVETPADGRRGNPNPTAWAAPSLSVRFDGRVQVRKDGGTTYWFDKAAPTGVALVCRHATAPVHAAGATVEPPSCSPCYELCRDSEPIWTPATTHPRSGLDCMLRAADEVGSDGVEKPVEIPWVPRIAGLGNDALIVTNSGHIFFAPAPGVEHLLGATDCPPEGLRVAR